MRSTYRPIRIDVYSPETNLTFTLAWEDDWMFSVSVSGTSAWMCKVRSEFNASEEVHRSLIRESVILNLLEKGEIGEEDVNVFVEALWSIV